MITLIDGASLLVTYLNQTTTDSTVLTGTSLQVTNLNTVTSDVTLFDGTSLCVGGYPVNGSTTTAANKIPRGKIIYKK